MLKKSWLFLIAGLAFAWLPAQTPAFAQVQTATPEAGAEAEAGLEVAEAVIATGSSGLEPQGVDTTFPADTKRLYCFTRITGGGPDDEIVHQWMKGDQVVASMTLKVKASPWRTYSMKTMPSEASGKWTVKIMEGKRVLKVVPFEIQ